MPSMKMMNLVIYAALTVISITVLWAVSDGPEPMPGDVGKGFFPSFLSWLIIGFSAIGAVRCIMAGPLGEFRVDYFSRMVFSVAAIAIFVLSWSRFGFFYGQAFVFLLVLFTYYRRPKGFGPRQVALNTGVAAGITLLCYIVFRHLIYVDL